MAARTVYVGVDEAGYGPNLGPLVVAGVAFAGPAGLDQQDWWQSFAPLFARTPTPDRLAIDDSKALFQTPAGQRAAMQTVCSFLHLVGHQPTTLLEFANSKRFDFCKSLRDEHWFVEGQPLHPPLCPLGDSFQQGLCRAGLEFLGVICRPIFPAEFNRRLDVLGNKSAVEIEAITAMLAEILAWPASNFPTTIVVDRLGGRKNYRSLVEEIADGAFPATLREDSQVSQYRFDLGGREVEIAFRVGADAFFLPVALASLFAKTVREQCMAGLNAFWAEQVPNLRPTAGYPTDAKRFLSAIEAHVDNLAIPKAALWRRL